jgi:hypothetical protein
MDATLSSPESFITLLVECLPNSDESYLWESTRQLEERLRPLLGVRAALNNLHLGKIVRDTIVRGFNTETGADNYPELYYQLAF